eukprot:403333030
MASQVNPRQNQRPLQPVQQNSQNSNQLRDTETIPQYMQVQETKAKRITTYTLKLSKTDFEQIHINKLKECLRKIKQYYERFDLQYDFEISPYQQDTGTVTVKASIHFNKRLHSGFSLASFISNSQNQNSGNGDLSEKLDFYIQVLEHLNNLCRVSGDFQIDPSWINLRPESLIKAGNVQVILTDFILPINQISSSSENQPKSNNFMDSQLSLPVWYMSQMSPEQMKDGKCGKQSLIWQLGCLLYRIMTNRWPFISQSRPSGNNGIIGIIRRNIVLCKYIVFRDETVQEQIFDKIFIEIDEKGQGRMSLDQLIEVTSLFLSNNKPKNQQSSLDNKRKKFESDIEDSELQTPVQNNDDLDQTEEVIEEDEYYNSDEERKDNLQSNQNDQQFERVKQQVKNQQQQQNPLKYQSQQQQPNSLLQSKIDQAKQSDKFTVQEYDAASAIKNSQSSQKDDYGYSNNKKDSNSQQSSNFQSSQMKSQQPNQKAKPKFDLNKIESEAEEHNFDLPEDADQEHQISNVPSFDNLPSMQSSRIESSRRESQQSARQEQQKPQTNFKKQQLKSEVVQDISRPGTSSKKNHPNFDDLSSLKSSRLGSQVSARDSQFGANDDLQHHGSESSFDMAQSYKIKIPQKVQDGQMPLNAQQLQSLQKNTNTNPSTAKKQPFELNNLKGSQNQQLNDDGQQSLKSSHLSSSRQQKSLSNLQSKNLPGQDINAKNSKYNPQVDDLPISFIDSARGSEKSASQSQFGGDFADDQSSIQHNDTEQNLDDQIGFIVALSETQCIGITIDTAQFMHFTFDKNSKKGQHQTIMVKNELTPVIGLRQLIKQMKIAADCICQSFEEPCFYVAKQNKIGKAFIDVSKDTKVQMSSKKIEFYSNDQVKVSSMCYTIMRDEIEDGQQESNFEKITGNKLSARSKQPGQVDGYMGIATSDYSFLILRINGKQGSQEVLAHIENAHESDITQVLALTDYTSLLSFVTLSLDAQIKIYGENGEEEYQMIADGQVITGLVPPQKSKDYFIVSSYNEELQQNFIEIYRKSKQILKLGPFAENNMILDLKLVGNTLFVPKSSHSIERQEVKGF